MNLRFVKSGAAGRSPVCNQLFGLAAHVEMKI